jgi:hypothetical protein
LREFVARHCIEQEQGRDTRESGAQRVKIEDIALRNFDPRREIRLGGITGQHSNFCFALDELVDDVAANAAGGSDYEDGHFIYS